MKFDYSEQSRDAFEEEKKWRHDQSSVGRHFQGEKRPDDFLLFGYWYIFTYEEMMKQDCKIFTFSREPFSHIQIPWCMCSFN